MITKEEYDRDLKNLVAVLTDYEQVKREIEIIIRN